MVATSKFPSPPVHLADTAHITTLVVDKLIVTTPGGGTVVGLTPPFIYTALGTEPPGGFNIFFPSGARGGPTYVAQVGLAGVANLLIIDAPAASYADDHIVVKTSGQLQAGDKLSVVISDQT